VSFAQDLKTINDDKLSFEEKVEIGKAYIDESFLDCDINVFAPHLALGNSGDKEESGTMTKGEWFDKYPNEYGLYNYCLVKENESFYTPEELQKKRQEEELIKREKIKFLEEEKNK